MCCCSGSLYDKLSIMPRFYLPVPLTVNTNVPLDERCFNHAIRVLRLRVKQPITLFNGEGGHYLAHLATIEKRGATAYIESYVAHDAESPLKITLIQSVAKGERMDFILQKACELGASTIQPVLSARTVVSLHDARWQKKWTHWQGVLISACEQSGRNQLPQLCPPQALADVLSQPFSGLRLSLSPTAMQSIAQQPRAASIQLLIGPEGGLNEAEIHAASAAGFIAIRMGPRILRTETAGLAAVAILQSHWGDL